MRKSILLGSCLALASISAHADEMSVEGGVPTQFAGFIEIGASAATWDNWGPSYNPWVGLGGAASLAYWLNDSMSTQIDVRHWSVGDNSDEGYYAALNSLIALHVNWSGDNHSIGGFGGFLSNNGYYESGIDVSVFGGVEGQVRLADAFTLDAQIGYIKNFRSYYPFGGVAFGQVAARVFLADNIKLEANVGLIAGQIGDDEDENALAITWGAEAEYQIAQRPFSIFVRYAGYTDRGTFGSTAHMLTAGARFSFNGMSLREQDAQGATHQIMGLSPISWLRLDNY